MWALKFTDRLLEALAKAFDENLSLSSNQRTLRHAVATAYDAALAQHHSWTIRKSVKGACLLLPSKEAFMNRIGLKKEDQAVYLKRLGSSMSPVVNRMYDYYDKYDLHGLP
ncbi:Glycolipid transfer protein [Gracilaria domingensis]|nr:Glycolipid transfer protein [Gracilaria domingensis]